MQRLLYLNCLLLVSCLCRAQIWSHFDNTNSTASYVTYAITVDAQDNKWFGSWNGLSKYDGTNWSEPQHIMFYADNIKAIATDNQGTMWFGVNSQGAYHDGVFKFDGSNLIHYNDTNSALVSNRVTALACDALGNLWVGSENKGVSKFDGTIWTTYDTLTSGIVGNEIASIAIDAQNTVWIGTLRGVSKFDGTNWTNYTTSNSGLANNNISSVFVDSNGNKWFGTNSIQFFASPISKFDGANWTTYNVDGDDVRAIAQDRQGNMWFGCKYFGFYGGLSKFDGTNWTLYNYSNSPIDDDILSLAADARGDLWVGAEQGDVWRLSDYPYVDFITVDSICPQNCISFTNRSQGAVSYQWLFPGAVPSSDTSSIPGNICYGNIGTHDITLIATTNGFSDTIKRQIVVHPPISMTLTTDSVLCSGRNLSLDMYMSGATYLWQNGSTNYYYNITQPGTYWLHRTYGDCISVDTVVLSGAPTPTINLGADTFLCSSKPIAIGVSYPGATYQWQDGSNNSIFQVTNSGYYSVTATLNACTDSDTIGVGDRISPVIYLPPYSDVCTNDYLYVSGSNNNTYLWQNGSTGVQCQATSSGLYWVKATFSGCSTYDSTIVTLLPLPNVNIGNDTSVCGSDTITLSAYHPLFINYLWQDNSQYTTYTVTQSGTYRVMVQDNNFCAGYDTIVVNINTPPSAPTITQAGQTLFSNSALSCQWYLNNNLISGATSSSYTPLIAGLYYVIVTDNNGCSSQPSNTINFVITTVLELDNKHVSIYPNPATNQLTINLGGLQTEQVNIYNVDGKLVSETKQPANNSIDISNLAKGVYVAEVKVREAVQRVRWVKM